MGKKSKSKSTKPSLCYHGCKTKKEFNSGAHYKLMESYDQRNTQEERDEFCKTNKRVLTDPALGRFVITRITNDFLKGKDDLTLRFHLLLLLYIRYYYIPKHEGKDVDSSESEYLIDLKKYFRDVQTERGRINCIAREIPCDCMKEKLIEAKLMEKVASCYGCQKEFSKNQMLRCKGC